MKADELYATITNRIIAAIEAGAGTFKMPWHAIGSQMSPLSVANRRYRGVNELWLAMVAIDKGWLSGRWGTYRAWQAADGQVRKGERATSVFLWKPTEKVVEGEDKPRRGLIAATYNVFAAEQCDGVDQFIEPVVVDRVVRDKEFDQLWINIGATVIYGGNRAYYQQGTDSIHVPFVGQFADEMAYHSTLAHEHAHWTGTRLQRDLRGRFGSEAYAMEELVAELTAAFVCGRMKGEAQPRPDHSEYLASWLKVFKNDMKAIVSVASKAQQACDLLCRLGGLDERSTDSEAGDDGGGGLSDGSDGCGDVDRRAVAAASAGL